MDLEQRIQSLEAVQEIMRLETEYCRAADTHDVDLFCSVFAEDATLNAVGKGEFTGIEAIRGFGQFLPQGFSWAMHRLHNADIKVDGDTATGNLYWTASLTDASTGSPMLAAGSYEDHYALVNGKWKIKKKIVNFFYQVPYEHSWSMA